MSDFLAAMAAASRLRAEGVRNGPGAAKLPSRASLARPALPLRLSVGGFDLIAEAKLASPSEGRLVFNGDDRDAVIGIASVLASSGPAALSVLTEPSRFAGDLDHLASVAGRIDLPVMRKDFLVDPIQVFEARAAGGSGVLLIARMLTESLLVEMTDLALELGMFVLVELFSDEDIEAASVVFGRDVLVGVNARDLSTLRVDPEGHERLFGGLPSDLPLVAESGIGTPEDVRRVADLGYRLALVGTALVSAPEPAGLAGEMMKAGREIAASRGVV